MKDSRLSRATPFLLPLGLLLGGCVTTSDYGRTQFVAPQGIGVAYSEIEMQAQLALKSDAACQGKECEAVAAFRREVHQLGTRLAKAARNLSVEAKTPAPYFYVQVPAKGEQGTLSSAGGSIVVFDGLRAVGFEEPALAFLVAREMGHVLARHHEENSATNIAFSIAATLLLPVANIVRGAAATLPATTAITATTTAASVAGSSILKGVYRPEQLREADTLALRIMIRAGWTPMEVADALQAAAPRLKDEGWMSELLVSKNRLDQITMGPPWLLPTNIADAGSGRSVTRDFE